MLSEEEWRMLHALLPFVINHVISYCDITIINTDRDSWNETGIRIGTLFVLCEQILHGGKILH